MILLKKIGWFLLLFLLPLNVLALTDTAAAAMVMDIDSGRVLYENNADEPRLIASITKIMTAVVALENGNLDEVITAGDEVLKMYGTNIYIERGEKMTLRDLLYGLLLRSGNDAAVVIANYIAKDEEAFVKLMNKKAKEIGMTNTVFHNSHGLDEETENYSTARDMALLSRYAYSHFKEYRKMSATKEHVVKTDNKSYLWYNRNKLLKQYEYCTGGKNGYTPRAGKTLVTTAEKDGLRLTTVTLKDGNEYVNHKNLADYAFDKYSAYQIVNKDKFSFSDDSIEGTLYVKKNFQYPLTEAEAADVKVLASVDPSLKEGKVGKIEIRLKKDQLASIPIYLKANKKEKKGFFSRLFS